MSNNITFDKQCSQPSVFDRTILDNLATFVGLLTTDGIIIDLNASTIKAGGIALEEVKGDFFWDAFWFQHSFPLQKKLREVCKLAATGVSSRFDTTVQTVNGLIVVDFQITPIRNQFGEITHLLPSGIDITDRYKVERNLTITQERFNLAKGAAEAGVYEYNIVTGELNWDPIIYQFWGFDPASQVSLKDWFEQMTEETRAQALKDFDRACDPASNGDYQSEFCVRNKITGQLCWISSHGKVTFHNGKPVRMVGICLNNTVRKQMEQRLSESEAMFRDLANHTPQLVWMVDNAGNIVWFNQRWTQFTGLDTLGSTREVWQQVFHPDHYHRIVEGFDKMFAKGKKWEDTFPIKNKNGKYRWFLSRAFPIRDEHGRIKHWIGTNTDVQQYREDQKQLKDLASKLAESDKRKDVFIATLAHELRNPLAALKSGLMLMERFTHDDLEMHGVQAAMQRQMGQLTTIVDDLLEVSRFTRGKMTIKKRNNFIDDIVWQAIESTKTEIEKARHELIVEIPNEKIPVFVDHHRVAQIITNLILNAVKYTPEGGKIMVAVKNKHNKVSVSVKDNGIGIPPTMLEHIFQLFTQINRKYEKSYSGLGLGLTLVRKIAEMHNGKVYAKSAGPGTGSEFILELPITAPKSRGITLQTAATAKITKSEKLKVLVVDDSDDAATLLALVIAELGHEVRRAVNGQHALEVAEEFQPNIVLMDLAMPVMNGYDATKLLKQKPWARDTKVIAVSGWGQEEDKKLTSAIGFDDHLVKPINLPDLAEHF